jgi:hypothetical protein
MVQLFVDGCATSKTRPPRGTIALISFVFHGVILGLGALVRPLVAVGGIGEVSGFPSALLFTLSPLRSLPNYDVL